jgi:hypothetical protein
MVVGDAAGEPDLSIVLRYTNRRICKPKTSTTSLLHENKRFLLTCRCFLLDSVGECCELGGYLVIVDGWMVALWFVSSVKRKLREYKKMTL